MTSPEGGRDASKLWRQRDSAMKTRRSCDLEGVVAASAPPLPAQLCARRRPCAAGSTCRRSQNDYLQFAEFLEYQTPNGFAHPCCNVLLYLRSHLPAASSPASRTTPAGKRHSTNTDHRWMNDSRSNCPVAPLRDDTLFLNVIGIFVAIGGGLAATVGEKIPLFLPGVSRRTMPILNGAEFSKGRRLPDVPRHAGIDG
jgi:hypothetical protein